jgi:hypothetical protein
MDSRRLSVEDSGDEVIPLQEKFRDSSFGVFYHDTKRKFFGLLLALIALALVPPLALPLTQVERQCLGSSSPDRAFDSAG